MSRSRRFDLLVFLATFFAFAYFNQGGGWNQNSRFAEVRAIVEEGRFAIDDFLVYRPFQGTDMLERARLYDGKYVQGGVRYRLAWVDMDWKLFPVNPQISDSGARDAAIVQVAASGDIGYVSWTREFHPNKPPGTSLLAVPGYWLVFHLEKLAGWNPDHWWIVVVNAWLTTILSVGLISALGCVFFFRLAREFARGHDVAAVLATLTLAFGTMYWPYGTILFDHSIVAALLVITFYLIHRGGTRSYLGAGLVGGMAAVTNYLAAVPLVFLGLYLLLARRRVDGGIDWRGALLYGTGAVPPFLLICWYGWTCFGSPFTLNTDFQNPLFRDETAVLGMFHEPSFYVAGLISFSPYRGLFYLSPVLLAGLAGLVVWLRGRTLAAEARLCCAMFGFFFLVNVCFNGYHGGFAVGPRYLVPALPFLALPLVVAFARWRWLTGTLASISLFNHTLLTATDAQSPLATGSLARINSREDAFYHLVGEYAWPLFAYGQALPILNLLVKERLEREGDRLDAEGAPENEKQTYLQGLERDLRDVMGRDGWRSSSIAPQLASLRGPVSVNPISVVEGTFYQLFEADTPQTRWASCNLGELLWPQSRWSLLPLLLVSGGASAAMLSLARRLSYGKAAKSQPGPVDAEES